MTTTHGRATQNRATYVLARHPMAPPGRMSLTALARAAGLHPELVRRYVALGLLECERDAAGELWFPAKALSTLARVQRLRAGLSLNYAAIGLVLDLLDRIEELESELSRARRALSSYREE